MLIGGSPGSTAGGMKTTTVAVHVCHGYIDFPAARIRSFLWTPD